jgi:hypothetical protein
MRRFSGKRTNRIDRRLLRIERRVRSKNRYAIKRSVPSIEGAHRPGVAAAEDDRDVPRAHGAVAAPRMNSGRVRAEGDAVHRGRVSLHYGDRRNGPDHLISRAAE